jgi:2-dehydro-3-deoxyphosphogluconate aldolase/(4S)-4-hydroxy-2-oxoglutarate aldolase
VNKQEVRARIEQLGIIPAIRVSSTEDALFAAEAVSQGGIPIAEVTMTVPDAHKVISHLVQNAPDVIVGAGGVSDVEMARRCLDDGAKFLTTDGLDPEIVKFATRENAVIIPGTLTPSEIIRAWKMEPDFVNIRRSRDRFAFELFGRGVFGSHRSPPLGSIYHHHVPGVSNDHSVNQSDAFGSR